jgi:hypothetical protein
MENARRKFCCIHHSCWSWWSLAKNSSSKIRLDKFWKNDKIVPYKIQKFSSKQYLKFLNADENNAKTEGEITYYKNPKNLEIVIEDRNAGHEFPQNSIPKMVDFLKRNHR